MTPQVADFQSAALCTHFTIFRSWKGSDLYMYYYLYVYLHTYKYFLSCENKNTVLKVILFTNVCVGCGLETLTYIAKGKTDSLLVSGTHLCPWFYCFFLILFKKNVCGIVNSDTKLFGKHLCFWWWQTVMGERTGTHMRLSHLPKTSSEIHKVTQSTMTWAKTLSGWCLSIHACSGVCSHTCAAQHNIFQSSCPSHGTPPLGKPKEIHVNKTLN